MVTTIIIARTDGADARAWSNLSEGNLIYLNSIKGGVGQCSHMFDGTSPRFQIITSLPRADLLNVSLCLCVSRSWMSCLEFSRIGWRITTRVVLTLVERRQFRFWIHRSGASGSLRR